VGEEVTDWLGDTGVLLISCCDVVVGATVSAAVACDVTVSLPTECVDETFAKTDDEWPARDDLNLEGKADVCDVARELDGDTENGDVEIVKTLVLCACIFGVRRRVPSVVDSNRKRTAESAMLLNAALL